MSNRELPMMPWYPDQFAASTGAMTWQEEYVYRRLLDAQWSAGLLSSDEKLLARLCKMDLRIFRRLWPAVRGKFVEIEPGKIRNFRLEEHRLAALDRKRKIVEAGRAGGQASVKRRSSAAQAPLKAMLNTPSPSEEEESSVPLGRSNPARALAAQRTLGRNGKHETRADDTPKAERVRRALQFLEADPDCTEHEAARLCHVSVDEIREARHT